MSEWREFFRYLVSDQRFWLGGMFGILVMAIAAIVDALA